MGRPPKSEEKTGTTTGEATMTTTDDAARRERKCVLCGGLIIGHGHNAAPVKDGQCCDHCNTYIVLPNRPRPKRSGPNNSSKGERA
jgi:hypothetical protein